MFECLLGSLAWHILSNSMLTVDFLEELLGNLIFLFIFKCLEYDK